MGEITKDMLIFKILKEHPELEPVLRHYNICECEPFKTLEKQAKLYKLDVDALVKELNEKRKD
jgi:predicted DNA-binding ribbon-helix-helix protein